MLKFVAALLLASALFLQPALAQQALIIATVNDKPITGFDVVQRALLMKALGDKRPADPKQLANDIIDDIVKIDEATKLKINPTDADIRQRLDEVGKNFQTDSVGLTAKLEKQGIPASVLGQFFAAQIAFGRILGTKYHVKVDVTEADVDKKMADIKADISGKVSKIEADPNRQPIKVYSLLQIDLPVDSGDPQLLQSRALEAEQIIAKFKGCNSAKAAAEGVFNVQIGKTLEADGRKLPPQLKAEFDKGGIGHAVGPVRGPKGLQVLGFCSTRMVTPPKLNITEPTREQVKNLITNEKYDEVRVKYSAILRKAAVVEFKDPAYAP